MSDRRLMVPLREAAELLGVSPATLKRAGKAGEIPVERILSVYLVPMAWLTAVTSWPRREAS